MTDAPPKDFIDEILTVCSIEQTEHYQSEPPDKRFRVYLCAGYISDSTFSGVGGTFDEAAAHAFDEAVVFARKVLAIEERRQALPGGERLLDG